MHIQTTYKNISIFRKYINVKGFDSLWQTCVNCVNSVIDQRRYFLTCIINADLKIKISLIRPTKRLTLKNSLQQVQCILLYMYFYFKYWNVIVLTTSLENFCQPPLRFSVEYTSVDNGFLEVSFSTVTLQSRHYYVIACSNILRFYF